MDINITMILAGVIAGAAPIVLATLGETLTEKAGIINLSLDGTILLSAMAAFVVALKSDSTLAGFAAGAGVGMSVAAVVAFFGITLGQSLVAVGFVLTLMARDLAYFLGNPYARVQGSQAGPVAIPFLSDIPVLGEAFFSHSLPVYLSLVLIPAMWWYIYRTPMGLTLRAVGENPDAAFARGIRSRRVQFAATMAGGVLVGLAGATFALATKPGWGRPQGAEGTGWIALALVIFGGWHPVRAAAGAYLFAFLQVMGIYFQAWLPWVPAQVFQVAPFPLMIFTLLILSWAQKDAIRDHAASRPWLRRLIALLSAQAPSALGQPRKQG